MPSHSTAKNERVKYVRSLYETRHRQRERAFVIEGVRLVEEALGAGAAPTVVLVAATTLERTARGRELLNRLQPFHPLDVGEQLLQAASDTVTPQGVLAVTPMPDVKTLEPAGPLVLVLEGLSDPGNVGTILRTAWASGIVRAVVGLGGVDFFNPKVVRSAAGAHFHLKLVPAWDWPVLRQHLAGRRLLVAVSSGGTSYAELDWPSSGALAIGSEAHGVSPAISSEADRLVHIPMPGRAESLNAAVAAGILLFEAARHIAPDRFSRPPSSP